MGFSYYQPPAGVAAELDPTALKIAQNLADLNSDALARANLGLSDLATTARGSLFEVVNPAGADDGDVLTADGAGSYTWEAPAGGGGGSSLPGSPVGVLLDYDPSRNVDADSSPNGYAAVLHGGGPTEATENGITVGSFSSDALEFELPRPANWTIIAMVKLTNNATFQHVCGSRDSLQNNDTAWGVLYNRDTPGAVDGGLRVIFGDDANASRIDTDDAVFPTGQWAVVAVRFNDGVADVEVNADGDDVATTVTEGNASSSTGDAEPFFIGYGGDNSFQSLNGSIARLLVWDRALNDDDFEYWRRELRNSYAALYEA